MRSRCCLAHCNVKHTFFIFTASLGGASGLVALRSRKPIRSDTPPSGLPAALLCFRPLIVIRSNRSLVSRTLSLPRSLPRTPVKLDLGPFDPASSEPILCRILFCIAEVSIPVLVGRDVLPASGSCLRFCAEPRMAVPRPLPLPLTPTPAAPIATSPSLSTRAGVVPRFCIPPLLGARLEDSRPEVRVALGPVGGGA